MRANEQRRRQTGAVGITGSCGNVAKVSVDFKPLNGNLKLELRVLGPPLTWARHPHRPAALAGMFNNHAESCQRGSY